ncbi:hypothetical protein TL16_g09751 [Triparma laevis f. inornata]|uniref:Uncharacterized protein n=1 Tax=Triparma laevis f. inornata TaxID=1714386 RepID=A0A9W7ELU9_9STRA|nr:hypothetical protein TL16_g09751 [Triparma laevis f. inornata]
MAKKSSKSKGSKEESLTTSGNPGSEASLIKPVEEDVGSKYPSQTQSLPGSQFNVLDKPGYYDDGGAKSLVCSAPLRERVGDLQLIIDLHDSVTKRIKGLPAYLVLKDSDGLPKARRGQMGKVSRGDQKGQLAQLLFCEDPGDEDKGPSEVFYGTASGEDDQLTLRHKIHRLQQAQASLRLSILLREAGCVSLSLSELCKRRLQVIKNGGAGALRAAKLALEICGEGRYESETGRSEATRIVENAFWDPELVVLEADDDNNIWDGPKVDTEGRQLGKDRIEDRSQPGLANGGNKKFINERVSLLCKRSAYLQKGNALQALGRFEEARTSYITCLGLLDDEIRTSRTDWERMSLNLNIGNAWLAEGNMEKAKEFWSKAEAYGTEHVEHELGAKKEGKAMIAAARKCLARGYSKQGEEGKAKEIVTELLEEKRKDMDIEAEERKKLEEEKKEKAAIKA